MTASMPRVFTSRPTKSVVRVEPTKVLTAISLPRMKNARTISRMLITTSIVPGEKGKNDSSMTEMPLVPPSRSASGNMNSTVEAA